MSGPPSLTEVQVSAGHAALAISTYAINPNVATLTGMAGITIAAQTATTEITGAPLVLSVSVDTITETSARVSWTVDQLV